jgi:hypothetical protein
MINIEILEGLRRATESGNTLKSSMMSFYNSGYKKQEIEAAAKELQSQKAGNPSTVVPAQVPQNIQTQPIVGQPPAQPIQQQPVAQPVQQIPQTTQPIPQVQQPVQPMNQQNVSQYGKKSKVSGMTVFLISSLIFLLILLTLMFVFRSQLINFFNKIF